MKTARQIAHEISATHDHINELKWQLEEEKRHINSLQQELEDYIKHLKIINLKLP